MLIDIDSLLNATDGWNLSLAIAGNQFIVDPPPSAARELLESILSGASITEAERPALEKLIGPLIREPSADVTKWSFGELVGASTAIAILAKQIYISHSRGICRAVASAMRPDSASNAAAAAPVHAAPNAPADHPARSPNAHFMPIQGAPRGSQAKSSPDVAHLSPQSREAMEAFIKSLTGNSVPPDTSDADLRKLAANASESAARPAQPAATGSEQKA